MKILCVSIKSIHFSRWTYQLRGAGYEIHWFDIDNGGYINELDWIEQHTGWKYKGGNFKGRTFLKKWIPGIHRLFENDLEKAFEKVLLKVKPDLVHSFVMYRCCVPIFDVMRRHPTIKWIYSSWGSDLYYFKNFPQFKSDINKVLPHIDYLFTDNFRDYKLATGLGFKGEFLGAFPGGGGFKIQELETFRLPLCERSIIIIKGYQGRSGRAITILEALKDIPNNLLKQYQIILFGADPEVVEKIKSDDKLKNVITSIYTKSQHIPHFDLLKLMGKSLIYVGNSNSDGMPNTLLESIIMGCFPIQSNPGGVTEEIIENGKNGLLIHDYNSTSEISMHLQRALTDYKLLQNSFDFNKTLRSKLDFNHIQKEVLLAYEKIKTENDF